MERDFRGGMTKVLWSVDLGFGKDYYGIWTLKWALGMDWVMQWMRHKYMVRMIQGQKCDANWTVPIGVSTVKFIYQV